MNAKEFKLICDRIIVALAFALGITALSHVSHAAPVTYLESVGGDLNGTQNFNFDIGTNSIAGTTGLILTPLPFLDTDAFTFDLPAGSQLTSVSLDFLVVLSVGTELAMTASLHEGINLIESDLVTVFTNGEFGPSPVSLFDSNLPLSTGLYGITIDPSANGLSSWDYTMTFEVSEVPLPATLPLYGTGLGLMALFGWWRRRRAAAA